MNKKAQVILLNLEKYKKKQNLSVMEKMEIFYYVYNITDADKPINLGNMLYVILDEYGESASMTDDYDKQLFVNIYGEPKSKYLQINKVEDVLDIVLNELSIRKELKPLFPSERNDNNLLTPYSKENSIEFLAMKKLNIYSSTSFDINRLIGNKRHIDFPMTEELLEELTWIDDFEQERKPIMTLTKNAYNNSREKYTRIFIQWFNSHFWNEEFGQIEFADDKKLFNNVFIPFKKNAKVPLTINSSHLNVTNNQSITILGGRELSKIGQEFLKTLYPFDTLVDNRIIFE